LLRQGCVIVRAVHSSQQRHANANSRRNRFGQEPQRMRLPPPSPAAISRMEETLGWLAWLEPADAKIVWLRATGERWKAFCWKVGLVRSAAHQHWLYALCVIVLRLNGRKVPGKRSRQFVVERAQADRM
jgi:hypothetical protein